MAPGDIREVFFSNGTLVAHVTRSEPPRSFDSDLQSHGHEREFFDHWARLLGSTFVLEELANGDTLISHVTRYEPRLGGERAMTTDLVWAGLAYAGIAMAFFLGQGCHPRVWKGACRTAWWAGWAGLAGRYAIEFAAAGHARFDIAWSFTIAAWVVAVALLTAGRSAGAWTKWSAAAVILALVSGARFGFDCGLATLASVVSSAFLWHAVYHRRWLPLRLAAYWLSFVGTCAWCLPLSLSSFRGGARVITEWVALPLAALLAVAAVLVAVRATAAFARVGGTPEPSDPPTQLCTAGPFSVVRHPIALLEIWLVLAGALLIGTRVSLIYCAVFTAFMIGPVRLWEERGLVLRFGQPYLQYAASVPAYWPRLKSLSPVAPTHIRRFNG